MIGLIAVTNAGRVAARRLREAWPDQTRTYGGPAAEAVARAWPQCQSLVCFLAAGATVRLIAPLLAAKHDDPAVVCVDESSSYAIALLGGHAAGANALAADVADVLGAAPVITTATDATGIPGLDCLGWPVEGAVAPVSRAILDGEPVRLESAQTWPLPPLPEHVGATGRYRILITDRDVPMDPHTAVLRPPSLVAGVGASRGVTTAEVLGLLEEALAEGGLSPRCVSHLATVEAKEREAGIVTAASERGWPLITYPASRLAGVPVPSPSPIVAAAVGTPSVAEASALAAGGTLVVRKRKSAMATVAVARVAARGRLSLIGLGPGARDLLAPRAAAELRRASVIIGLDQYLDQVRDLLRPGTRILESGLGAEEERARVAVEQARRGHAVALVGSGDAGVYAMASPALELAGDDIDVVGVPGVTAALAAASLLGAPLGHDHAVLSLSDLHTPWGVIERRVLAAAESDLVVAFYNPRSRARDWQLRSAVEILARHRPAATPVGVVRDASRPGQRITLTTVGEFTPETADMVSVVIVGCSATRVVAGRMITPRGYRWLRT